MQQSSTGWDKAVSFDPGGKIRCSNLRRSEDAGVKKLRKNYNENADYFDEGQTIANVLSEMTDLEKTCDNNDDYFKDLDDDSQTYVDFENENKIDSAFAQRKSLSSWGTPNSTKKMPAALAIKDIL